MSAAGSASLLHDGLTCTLGNPSWCSTTGTFFGLTSFPSTSATGLVLEGALHRFADVGRIIDPSVMEGVRHLVSVESSRYGKSFR